MLKTVNIYKYIIEKYNLIFYSDDVMIRNYICEEKEDKYSITTLDILRILCEKRILSHTEKAKYISTMFGWNI